MPLLAAHALAHFLVDAICAAVLLGSGNGASLLPLLLVYNTLAFSGQALFGLLTDRLGRCETLSAAACAFLGLSALLPLPPMLAAVCLGIGNCVFHVAAGSVTLEDAGGKAAPLGVFVAPGALGVVFGKLWPGFPAALAALLLLIAALLFFLGRKRPARQAPAPTEPSRGAVIALLLLAVAARALGGTAAFFSWQTGAMAILVTAAFVVAGKAAGGFVCDRWGARRTALLSIPAAALLIAFGGGSMPLSLLGQLLLNLSMPVTLWLLWREMPDAPGLAFGLAAAALWPGQLLGQMLAEGLSVRWPWILLGFAPGLFAILYAEKRRKNP